MDKLPVRKNIRLKDYDYSQNGAYFITICVKDRHESLWKAHVGAASCRPQLNKTGEIVKDEISVLSATYAKVTLEKYVIMPNHVHIIVVIAGNGRQNAAPTISQAINQWKRETSMKIGYSIWQKSFHDHIIRNEEEYRKIWQYIDENPARWQDDCYYTV